MKKIIAIILAIIVTGIGLTVAFSYHPPKTKTYLELTDIDKKINETTEMDHLSLEKNINQLYQSVHTLITIGETYTEGTETDKAFEDFNQAYELSKQLEEQLGGFIKTDVTSDLEKTTEKLTEEQKQIAMEAINLENKRLEELKNIHQTLQTLTKNLANIKDTFYNAKPSEAIQYFNSVNNEFKNFKDSYGAYVEITTQYFQVKEKLYQSLKTA